MQKIKNQYKVIGLMSGTSMDGLDIALCNFQLKNNQWSFSLERAITCSYSAEWKRQLSMANQLNGYELVLLHNRYGEYIGNLIQDFRANLEDNIDLIASHGHTIFHQPQNGLTLQIGNGASIAAITGIPVVADFRTMDIALGGQGAPLVPIGDKLLFPQYKACLNLGGFANISFDNDQNLRVAFDICPVNIVLNAFAASKGLSFDDKGKLGKSGKVDRKLLQRLNAIDFYRKNGPKSLGKEWVEQIVFPLLNDNQHLLEEDKLCTFYHHIACQIVKVMSSENITQMLVTGGGALNEFLIELIRKQTTTDLVLPEESIISFKEALIFAFLGLLRYRGEINCLSSVTGSKRDHSAGVLYESTV